MPIDRSLQWFTGFFEVWRKTPHQTFVSPEIYLGGVIKGHYIKPSDISEQYSRQRTGETGRRACCRFFFFKAYQLITLPH